LNQLPTSISGVIAERIERLDKEQQKIISYASVEGNEISVPILENLLK
jgi:predicted ATPase